LAGIFLFFVPFQEIIDAIRGASPYYFWMSYLLGFPTSYLGATRLWILTRKQGIQASPLKLMEINYVIKFYSFFSPASAVGSIMRWYKLSGDGKSAEALTAVAVNRLFDIFIAIVFGMFWVIGGSNQAILVQPRWILLFLAIVLLLWLVVTRYSHPILLWIRRITEKTHWNWLRKVRGYMERLSSSLLVYSRLEIHTLLLITIIGLLSELIGVLSFYYLALSIGLQVSITNLGWMRSIFFLVSLAPFTLTGGIGLREVSIVWVLTAMGVHADLAVAFSFLVYARSAISSLTGGLIELISLRKIHE
jgi:uncharacterized protein (TIRG00374 family)